MSGQGKVRYGRLDLSWDELASLPGDQAAALALTAHVVNELNVLFRLFHLSSHPTKVDAFIAATLEVQRNTLLRLMSGKILEYWKFICHVGDQQSSGDISVNALRNRVGSKYAYLFGEGDKHFAAELRNSGTFHYDFKRAKRVLKSDAGAPDCSVFIHDTGSNTVSSVGEHVMFYGAMGLYQGATSPLERAVVIDKWVTDTLEGKRMVDFAFAEMVEEFVLARFPDKTVVEHREEVATELISSTLGYRIPVVLVKDGFDAS